MAEYGVLPGRLVKDESLSGGVKGEGMKKDLLQLDA